MPPNLFDRKSPILLKMEEEMYLPGGERRAHFLEMLTDEDPSRRWKAIEVLAREKDPSTVDSLIRALSDDDWRVRQKAAWALGVIGDPRAILPLRRAMREEREGVKEILLEALFEITRRSRD